MNKLLTNRIVGVFLSTILSFPIAFGAYANHDPALNPALQNACGLDIVLVLDVSGSLNATELQQEKDAAKAFVNAFLPATPTKIGIVSFSSTGTVVQDLTDDVADLESDIQGLSGGGSTNWQDALLDARGLLEGGLDRDDASNPDLIVMFSDGSPNTGGDYQLEANNAKTSSSSLPIRILGVAVGQNANVNSFKTITNGASSVISPVPDPMSLATDIVVSDFDQLAATLADLALALCDKCTGGGDVKVINKNSANVLNVVSSSADTGDNTAGGSTGGNGGNGGGVSNTGSNNDANGNTTGNGGTGGDAGAGGTVLSGNATSLADATTYANSNLTEIDRCGCCCGGDDLVVNKNHVRTKSIVRSHGDTGDNTAGGSTGGNGSAGGAVANNGSNNDANGNTTGNGGAGGSGGEEEQLSGLVQTGDALSIASVLNKINRNITRIFR